MDVEQLERIASELVYRVRDEEPVANGRWLLEELPDPGDWFRLAVVLAAAVPDHQTWLELTSWVDRPLPPVAGDCGEPAGFRRHRRAGEPLDRACRLAEAAYKREWRAAHQQAEQEDAA